MSQTVHRMRVALALLAFVVVAVFAGVFSFVTTATATMAQMASVAFVALTAAVIIVAASKRHDVTYFQTALNLLSMAFFAIMQAVGIAQFTHAIAGPSITTRPKIYGHQNPRRDRFDSRRAHGRDKGMMQRARRVPLKV